MNSRSHDDELVRRVLQREIKEHPLSGIKLVLDSKLNLRMGSVDGPIKFFYHQGDFRKQVNGPIIAYVRDGRLRDGPQGEILAELDIDGNAHLPGEKKHKINLLDYLNGAEISYK